MFKLFFSIDIEMTDVYHTKYGKVSLLSNDIHFRESFMRGQYWDEDTLLKLNCYIDSDKDILEIGGHVGTSSLVYASFLNKGKIHVYEPQRNLYELLEDNIKTNNLTHKIIPHHRAVFCRSGIARMNEFDIDYSLGNVKKRYNEDRHLPCNFGGIGLGKDGEKVKVITIDSMNLENLGYIHLDAQGAEPFILHGGRETIRKFRPLIYFEDNSKHCPFLFKNVCKSYPEHNEESQFDVVRFCMEELGYESYIERFNGGIDTLLLPK
jgi:FkbM family methyltransferase